MLLHVNLETLAIALEPPISEFVAHAVEKRTAAEVQPADQHSAQVAEMRDSVPSGPQGAEKLDGGADRDERPHRNHDGKGEDPNAAVRKQNGIGDKDAENRAGCADRRDVARAVSPEHRKYFNQNGDHPGADSAEEKVIQEAVPAPDQFQFAPEHPQKQHIEEQVEKAAVEEYVGNGLPDAQPGDGSKGHESELMINP